jgi:ABC-type glycerol-3-phosphate transport system permease component
MSRSSLPRRAPIQALVPEITPARWIGGSTLLLACVLPPFILLVPLVFLLGRQTHPTRTDWGIAAVALVAPFGVRALRRRR